VTRDRKGQTFMPGFLTAVWHTPVISEGQLPGGGDLFAACARAVESAPDEPLAISFGGAVIHRTRNDDEKA
jgi:hypothetical protein